MQNIINIFLFPFVPIIAGLLLAFGAFFLLSSAGNPGRITQGKTIVFAVIIGLIIIYAAWATVGTFLTLIGVVNWTGLGNWWEVDCSVTTVAGGGGGGLSRLGVWAPAGDVRATIGAEELGRSVGAGENDRIA